LFRASANRERDRRTGSNKMKTHRAIAELVHDEKDVEEIYRGEGEGSTL
jgi:hypothetical protein